MTMNFMPTLNKIHGDRSRININSLEYTYLELLSFNKKYLIKCECKFYKYHKYAVNLLDFAGWTST